MPKNIIQYLYNLTPGQCIEYISNTTLDIDTNEYEIISEGHPEYDELKWKFAGGKIPSYEEQLDKAISSHSLIIRKK